jgi:hypothetical protein
MASHPSRLTARRPCNRGQLFVLAGRRVNSHRGTAAISRSRLSTAVAEGWSREQALDYLGSNTALSLHEVETETNRYIAWPGQALAYKMGELKILELRAKAHDALGERFDLRAFHDAVLENGGVPRGPNPSCSEFTRNLLSV